MTRAPDILTASRGVIAALIIALGFLGPRALGWVVFLTMIGWTTDILDGRLARRQRKGPTWVGEHEFAFDMLMVFAALCYLVMAGFVPVIPAAIYVAVAALFIVMFQSKSVTMSFAFPLVALPLVVAYFCAPQAAYIYIAWIGLALIYDWRRFVGVVREFLVNIKDLYKRLGAD
ncbi:CDP-alcohol phosphatidyltransferase family protein [Candidatus Bipolaricaulota bacterium]|nr:CDP-alcohol phosphatidyltransferase family protein [Candidatus Bipolaricaulota bacterium]